MSQQADQCRTTHREHLMVHSKLWQLRQKQLWRRWSTEMALRKKMTSLGQFVTSPETLRRDSKPIQNRGDNLNNLPITAGLSSGFLMVLMLLSESALNNSSHNCSAFFSHLRQQMILKSSYFRLIQQNCKQTIAYLHIYCCRLTFSFIWSHVCGHVINISSATNHKNSFPPHIFVD